MNFSTSTDSQRTSVNNEYRQHEFAERNFHSRNETTGRTNGNANTFGEKTKRKIGVFFGKTIEKTKEAIDTDSTSDCDIVERRRRNEQLSDASRSFNIRSLRNGKTKQCTRSLRLGHFFHVSKRTLRRPSVSEKLLSNTSVDNFTFSHGTRSKMEKFGRGHKAVNSGWITGFGSDFADSNGERSDNDKNTFDHEKISIVQSRTETGRQPVVIMEFDSINDKIDGDNAIRILASELYVRHLGKHGRYISDICVPTTPEDFTQLLQEFRSNLLGTQRKPIGDRQWRLVSRHGDHFHVLHICTYSNATCRCTWLDRSPTWRRCRRTRFRRRVYVSDLTLHDWENIIRYFSTKGHTIQDIEGGGEDGGLRLRIETIQVI